MNVLKRAVDNNPLIFRVIENTTLEIEKAGKEMELLIGRAEEMIGSTVTLNLVNHKHVIIRLVSHESETGTADWYLEIRVNHLQLQANEATPSSFLLWIALDIDGRQIPGEIG